MAKRMSPAARSAARQNYEEAAAHSAPGEGSRFKAVEAEAAANGASNPAAVAAAVGRRKYGKAKFAAMGRAGRKGKK